MFVTSLAGANWITTVEPTKAGPWVFTCIFESRQPHMAHLGVQEGHILIDEQQEVAHPGRHVVLKVLGQVLRERPTGKCVRQALPLLSAIRSQCVFCTALAVRRARHVHC